MYFSVLKASGGPSCCALHIRQVAGECSLSAKVAERRFGCTVHRASRSIHGFHFNLASVNLLRDGELCDGPPKLHDWIVASSACTTGVSQGSVPILMHSTLLKMCWIPFTRHTLSNSHTHSTSSSTAAGSPFHMARCTVPHQLNTALLGCHPDSTVVVCFHAHECSAVLRRVGC